MLGKEREIIERLEAESRGLSTSLVVDLTKSSLFSPLIKLFL